VRVQGDPDPARNGVYYLHGDHLGSASLTTDATGNRVGELRYLPYGETRSEWGVTPTGRRFTGQLEESGLGSLYDYGARRYSPLLGRFVSADTVVPNPSQSRDLNRYAYAANNPLGFVDPNGHQIRPPSTCGALCYTGTTGPYVSSITTVASPSVQSLTVGTSYSRKDMYISAGGLRPDDGVSLLCHTPGSLDRREEVVIIHGQAEYGIVAGEAEARHVKLYNGLLGSTVKQEFTEVAGSGGIGVAVPLVGHATVGGEVASMGGLQPSISADFGGLQAQLQTSQLMIGAVAKAGPGARVGAQWNYPERRRFLTSQGYLEKLGGVGAFSKRIGDGTSCMEEIYMSGYRNSQGEWISGYSILRVLFRLAVQRQGGFYYEEYP